MSVAVDGVALQPRASGAPPQRLPLLHQRRCGDLRQYDSAYWLECANEFECIVSAGALHLQIVASDSFLNLRAALQRVAPDADSSDDRDDAAATYFAADSDDAAAADSAADSDDADAHEWLVERAEESDVLPQKVDATAMSALWQHGGAPSAAAAAATAGGCQAWHGLLGQTIPRSVGAPGWRAPAACSASESSAAAAGSSTRAFRPVGEISDYIEQSGALFGDEFTFNRYAFRCASNSA
jgi:hypothetical protein